jgi:site-specific recombinase XerC
MYRWAISRIEEYIKHTEIEIEINKHMIENYKEKIKKILKEEKIKKLKDVK